MPHAPSYYLSQWWHKSLSRDDVPRLQWVEYVAHFHTYQSAPDGILNTKVVAQFGMCNKKHKIQRSHSKLKIVTVIAISLLGVLRTVRASASCLSLCAIYNWYSSGTKLPGIKSPKSSSVIERIKPICGLSLALSRQFNVFSESE